MRKTSILFLVVVHCLLLRSPCRARRRRSISNKNNNKALFSRVPGGRKRSAFLAGPLGSVDLRSSDLHRTKSNNENQYYSVAGSNDGATKSLNRDSSNSDDTIKAAATQALKSILVNQMGATGDEVVKPTSRPIFVDPQTNNLHVRFQQSIHGLPIEGTALNLHVTPDGAVAAVNGEFIPSDSMELRILVECHQALETARNDTGIKGSWAWVSPCVPAAVLGNDGMGYKCWKRTVETRTAGQPVRREVLYASGVNGRLIARHPQTLGARSLETRNCNTTKDNCVVVSTSSDPISTGDVAIDAAHNNAIKVYDFLKNVYGRDSLDNAGMTIVSRVHYDKKYVNAFWDTNLNIMSYGDGDGVQYTYLSLGLDVVAHELGHGVTWYESRLQYQYEPGAINEALSDIFASSVDRLVGGKSINDTWLIGEDVALAGDPFRDMSDPARYSDGSDYYPDRYKGEDDNGGTHVNSGIANLAFALLVGGGKHPRQKTAITVPKYRDLFNDSIKDAAALFYSANVGCLTPSSGFNVLLECLLMFANSTTDDATIKSAFAAVGVKSPVVSALTNGAPLTNQQGSYFDTYYYKLDGVLAGEAVKCQTSADNGDADLFVRIGELPDPYQFSTLNDCMSGNTGSVEECSTGPLLEPSTVYAAVNAAEDYQQLSIECTRSGNVAQLSSGLPLRNQSSDANTTKYYVLENIARGFRVTCATVGAVGDADLFVRIGSLPEPNVVGGYDCFSVTAGVSNQNCTAVNQQSNTSSAYVAVVATTAFEGLSLTCTMRLGSGGGGGGGGGSGGGGGGGGSDGGGGSTEAGNFTYTELSNGMPLRNQNASPSQTKLYKLRKGVTAGEELTCSLSGGVGDANLFVRFGSKPNPNKPSSNACYSQKTGLNDRCTAGPVKKSLDAFVAVSTASGFSNVTVTCSRKWKCSVKQQSCRTSQDCCSTDLTCVGPTPSARVCKRRANTVCTRSGSLLQGRTCFGPGNGNSSGTGSGTCKARGESCVLRSDCCGRGQGKYKVLTCDGETKDSRVCKACLSRGSTCSRHRQCCKGYQCQRGACRPIL